MIKQIITCPIVYITKLSILLQFNRLFAPHKLGRAYWFIQGVIWINTAYYLAGMLATIFECTPRSKAWDVFTSGGYCVDIAALIVVGAIINLISDLVMLLIPLFCISSLKLPLRKKIGVSCVFATGALWVSCFLLLFEGSFLGATSPFFRFFFVSKTNEMPPTVPVSRASCALLQVSISLANKISALHTFLS